MRAIRARFPARTPAHALAQSPCQAPSIVRSTQMHRARCERRQVERGLDWRTRAVPSGRVGVRRAAPAPPRAGRRALQSRPQEVGAMPSRPLSDRPAPAAVAVAKVAAAATKPSLRPFHRPRPPLGHMARAGGRRLRPVDGHGRLNASTRPKTAPTSTSPAADHQLDGLARTALIIAGCERVSSWTFPPSGPRLSLGSLAAGASVPKIIAAVIT